MPDDTRSPAPCEIEHGVTGHLAEARITWADGDVQRVCRPAANAARRWAPSARVEEGTHA
jgi:hypothetical protein